MNSTATPTREELAELQHDRRQGEIDRAKLARIEQIVDRHRLMTGQQLHDKIVGVIRGWICTKHGTARCDVCDTLKESA